jgi:hypothetical protein
MAKVSDDTFAKPEIIPVFGITLNYYGLCG